MNEVGKVHYVILPEGAAAPTSAEVRESPFHRVHLSLGICVSCVASFVQVVAQTAYP